jgi:hypothetical protein
LTAPTSDTADLRYRASAAVLLPVLGLLLCSLLWLVAHQQQRSWPGESQVPVVLSGEHFRVSASQLGWLQHFSRLHFSAGEQDARALLEAEVDSRLAQIFGGVHGRLPAFADWYYSLRGEYSRMGMAVLSAIHLSDGDFVAERAGSMLFPADVWDTELEWLEQAAVVRLDAHNAAVRAGWLQELSQRLAPARVPAPVAFDDERAPAYVALDPLLSRLVERERAALETRVSVSTVAAGGVAAGPAVWRAVSSRTAASGGRAAAARTAGRGAARVGSAAAGGAAVCAPGGPAAAGCALAAAAATWIAADWALLKVDEARNREALLAALEASLGDLHAAMRDDLLSAYDALVTGHYSALQDEIERTFVPVRAVGALQAAGGHNPNG